MRWTVKEFAEVTSNFGHNFYVKDTSSPFRAIGVPGDMVVPERQLTYEEAHIIADALNSHEKENSLD